MDARVSLRAACIGLLLTIPVAGQPQQAEQQETPRRDQTRQPARDAQRQQQPPAKPGSEAGKDQALSARQTFSGNVEHGRYLAERVAMCVECHSGRDQAGNIVDSERFMGAPVPVKSPWKDEWAIRAPRNRGLPGYTEEEGIRLLTEEAIARDGRQLRLPMPRFRMTKQDAADVVAYLKSLE